MKQISNYLRPWATALTTGAFFVVALTGVLMFFHIDTGLNKTAHEWLGWALVIGGLAHLVTNFRSFRQHLKRPISATIIAVSVVLLGLSFLSPGGSEEGNPMILAVNSITKASINELAPLVHKPSQEIVTALQSNAISVNNPANDTIDSISAGDRKKKMQMIRIVFSSTK